ncbi:hypothetical protein E2C01_001217 [Portunus trituberculatus]|uniref:Uncharacterized protein n=1 Tax=Portunus trituberculatus TaxID=210409 RepID=A0A5B7CGM6_PORTR|nr:hypothetical protein [Portunus trituberculatus]
MSIKLEDMLTVVKPPPQALDLFRTKIKCKEDFDKAFEKVPEYKIRPEKSTVIRCSYQKRIRHRSTSRHSGFVRT